MRNNLKLTSYITSKKGQVLFAIISVTILLLVYMCLSIERHQLNPNDKLLPLPAQLWEALVTSISPTESGSGVLISDTIASISRLFKSILLCGLISIVISQIMHLSIIFRAFVLPIVILLAKIPPIALLPALLLWLGLGEISKITLVVLGITPTVTILLFHQLQHDYLTMKDKLHTLDLPLSHRIFIIDLPRLWPSFLHFIRLNLAPAWLFILVAERVGTDSGLGYRIFLVKRYLSMDVILVYTSWITILSVLLYMLIGLIINTASWYTEKQ